MQNRDLKSMSIDELWAFHEEVVGELGQKIAAEKASLEERLRKLNSIPSLRKVEPLRRPYPKVHAKYRNPNNPAETWAGRGKQPRWVRTLLRSGKKLDELRIERG
jgi:DNA-binding protein H-NS